MILFDERADWYFPLIQKIEGNDPNEKKKNRSWCKWRLWYHLCNQFCKKLKENPLVETHGIISTWAKENLKLESDMTLHEFEDLFDYHYSNKDLGAAVASGSF